MGNEYISILYFNICIFDNFDKLLQIIKKRLFYM